jgi:hypothetical protein
VGLGLLEELYIYIYTRTYTNIQFWDDESVNRSVVPVALSCDTSVLHFCSHYTVFKYIFLLNDNILWLWVFIKLSHCISWPMNQLELSSRVASFSAINTHWRTGRILRAPQFHIFYITVSWKLSWAGGSLWVSSCNKCQSDAGGNIPINGRDTMFGKRVTFFLCSSKFSLHTI